MRAAGKVKQRKVAIFTKEQFVRTLKAAYNSESIYLDVSEFGTVYVYNDRMDVPKSQEGLKGVLTNFLGVGKVTDVAGTYKDVWVAYKED